MVVGQATLVTNTAEPQGCVSPHPVIESLDEITWMHRVRFRDRQYLPDCPGLYIVVGFPRRVLYIGIATMSIRKRWASHHRLPALRAFDRMGVRMSIMYLTCIPASELADIERAAIKKFNPVLNGRSDTGIAVEVFGDVVQFHPLVREGGKGWKVRPKQPATDS